jgi:hypothetical protein
MNAQRVSCMGGFCALRDHCRHYHSQWRSQPSERLCIPGHDGKSDVVFVQILRPAVQVDRLPSQEVA